MTPSTWTEYTGVARTTAIYPNIGHNLAYAALGLAGESAELFAATSEETVAEAGDVCWYVAALCWETGINPDTLCHLPDGGDATTIMCAAGKIAEAAKKTLRDDNGHITDSRMRTIADNLNTIAGALATVAATAGSSLGELWASNANKLLDRQQRNVLEGDGDHR